MFFPLLYLKPFADMKINMRKINMRIRNTVEYFRVEEIRARVTLEDLSPLPLTEEEL